MYRVACVLQKQYICAMSVPAYRQFCHSEPNLPLFMQDWYLDAVCENGSWDAITIDRNGKTIAVFPYFLKKKGFWHYIIMPKLCKFLGPYIIAEYRGNSEETKLYEALLLQLPAKLAIFLQDTNYTFENWLPFYWNGYQQTTRYSYLLDLLPDEQALYKGIDKNYRQKIKKASQLVTVTQTPDVAALFALVSASFKRQNAPPPYSYAFLEKLYQALTAHHACRMFFAKDIVTGQIHSAALLVWDQQAAYYLISGDEPSLRQSGSAVLLKWESILYAKQVLGLPIFDFEGSMIQRLEMGRRAFGAVQKPYFRIQKMSVWWKMVVGVFQ